MNKKSLYLILGMILGLLLGFGAAFLIMNGMNKESDMVSSKEAVVDGDVIEAEEEMGSSEVVDDGDTIEEESDLASIKEEVVGGEVFKVESLYCDLYYPTKWEDKVLIEETLNVVHFSADFGEGKTITLFDVVAVELSEDEEDGEIEVHIVLYDLEFDEQWSDEQKQIIIEMQEDASCIADYLEKDNIAVIM